MKNLPLLKVSKWPKNVFALHTCIKRYVRKITVNDMGVQSDILMVALSREGVRGGVDFLTKGVILVM